MPTAPKAQLSALIDQSYFDAYALHGDLNLSIVDYRNRLEQIVTKHMGEQPSETAAVRFCRLLHTSDLYLTTACAHISELAWSRFATLYTAFISKAAESSCLAKDSASELAGSIPGHLFLRDSSGQSRIASYDGQVTLATWLRVIITRRALNERERKYNHTERLENSSEVADHSALKRLEADLRASLYEKAIAEALRAATSSLNERERLILMLRHKDGMESKDIARYLGAHASTVSRQLQHIYKKLRDETALHLMRKHTLAVSAVEECEAEIVENPAHCIML